MFDVHVDVFQAHLPLELAVVDLFVNLMQSSYDAFGLVGRHHADAAEHAAVRDRRSDVVPIEALVECHRSGKGFHERIGGFRKPAAHRVRIFAHERTFDCDWVRSIRHLQQPITLKPW